MFVIQTQRADALDGGIWVNYSGSSFKVAHTSNAKFQRRLAALQSPHRRAIEKGTLDPEESRSIVCQALSEAILKGWENVKDQDGNDVPYSQKTAMMALMNNEGLREFVQETAADFSAFQDSEVKDKGND